MEGNHLERLTPKFSLSRNELSDIISFVDEKVCSLPEAECPPSLLDLHEKLIKIYYDTFIEVQHDAAS